MTQRKGPGNRGPGQPIAGMRPGGPNNPDPGYTPGPDYVDPTAGGVESAGDLEGGGFGGDIDRPDITGRGTTDDIVRHGHSDRDVTNSDPAPKRRDDKPRRGPAKRRRR